MDGMTREITGECPYCGQQRILTVQADATEENIRIAAVLACGCTQALHYQEKTRRIRSAKEHVESLFGRDAREFKQDEGVIDFMKRGIELVDCGFLRSFTLVFGEGVKCKIAVMNDDKIKVVREFKSMVELKK